MIVQVIAWIFVILWLALYHGERANSPWDSRMASAGVSCVKSLVLLSLSGIALLAISVLAIALFGGFN